MGPDLDILALPWNCKEFGATTLCNGECARRESEGNRTVRDKLTI